MSIAARDEHSHKAFQGNGCFCSGDSSIGVKEVGGFPSFHPKRAWRKFLHALFLPFVLCLPRFHWWNREYQQNPYPIISGPRCLLIFQQEPTQTLLGLFAVADGKFSRQQDVLNALRLLEWVFIGRFVGDGIRVKDGNVRCHPFL